MYVCVPCTFVYHVRLCTMYVCVPCTFVYHVRLCTMYVCVRILMLVGERLSHCHTDDVSVALMTSLHS
eukprot:COSAG01_NODE_3353_length_6219_cov_30.047059_1_plen_68_part_00